MNYFFPSVLDIELDLISESGVIFVAGFNLEIDEKAMMMIK